MLYYFWLCFLYMLLYMFFMLMVLDVWLYTCDMHNIFTLCDDVLRFIHGINANLALHWLMNLYRH